MNTIVLLIEKIPGALITNISISYKEVMLLYIIFISFMVFKKNQNKQLLLSLLFLFNIFLGIHIIDIIKSKHHVEVVNYDITKCAAFQFCKNGNAIFISDSIQNGLDKRYQFSIQNHDRIIRIKNIFIRMDEDFENSFFCKKGVFIFFQDTIYVLERSRFKPNTVNLIVYNHNFSDRSIHKLK
jgi:hypothetical protein